MRLLHRLLEGKYRTKMVRTYILVALIPFVILSLFGGITMLKNGQKTVEEHTAQMVRQVQTSMDIYIGMMEKIGNYISKTICTTSIFQAKTLEALQQSGDFSAVEDVLERISSSYPEIVGILVASRNELYVSDGMSRLTRDPLVKEEWYQQAVARPDDIVIVSNAIGRNIIGVQEYSVDDVFSLSKAIRDPVGGAVIGVLLMDVSHEIIQESINEVTIGERGFVFVLDQSDNMVYTPVNDLVYRIDPGLLHAGTEDMVNTHIKGAEYQIQYSQSDYTGWKTVGVFSIGEMMAGTYMVLGVMAGCVVLTLLLVIIASVRLTDSVTEPILKLRMLMKKAEEGDLKVRFESSSTDEIGELGQSFNNMIDRIEELVHMVYLEQQSKRNAELKSLQEQIKPHFLYNTLDTISWMARDYDAEDIVLLVDALSNMFRIGLSQGKDFITLREEVTHITNYLYIQKIRYKDKLQYVLDIPQALMGYSVPKLILQPLVENAIYHGIKVKRGGGTIRVLGRREAGKLKLIVADDGAGIAPEKLRALQEGLAAATPISEKSSFGLFYIQERIRLCYGGEYGVTIDSVQGEGTQVMITLPEEWELGERYV